MTFHLDLNKKYLLGISGGCDSMCLLSLCIKNKLNVVVAHVNYKRRDNADKEQKIVENFCNQNNITCYVDYPKQNEKGNFENWAREARYNFYQEIYEKEKCDVLLLGHQLDDHIETYLMALERKSHGWYYGIKKENHHHGMNIIRPLLDYRKKDTRAYCEENNVAYGDDESNFSDDYTRNKIRHALVEPATDKQIQTWKDEMNLLNENIQKVLKYIADKYVISQISIEQYKQESKQVRHSILRLQIEQYISQPLNQNFIDEIDRQLLACNKLKMPIDSNHCIYQDQGWIYTYPNEVYYEYKLDKLEYFQTDYFALAKQGTSLQALTVKEEDFPLTIRPAKKDDEIKMRFGSKKCNRIFIDKKILHKDRITYPVVVNKNNEVIFVPLIGCDIAHYTTKPNLFVI